MAGSLPSLRLVSENSLAALIRAERAARNMSQADLAREFGVRPQTIGAWEKGDTPPQVRFFDRLAEFLGLRGAAEVRKLLRGGGTANSPEQPHPAEDRIEGSDSRETEIRLNISRRIASGMPLSADEIEIFKRLLEPLKVPHHGSAGEETDR